MLASPVAARKVLNGLADLAHADDPTGTGAGLRGARWEPVVIAAFVLARDLHIARHDQQTPQLGPEPEPPRRPGQVRYRLP